MSVTDYMTKSSMLLILSYTCCMMYMCDDGVGSTLSIWVFSKRETLARSKVIKFSEVSFGTVTFTERVTITKSETSHIIAMYFKRLESVYEENGYKRWEIIG